MRPSTIHLVISSRKRGKVASEMHQVDATPSPSAHFQIYSHLHSQQHSAGIMTITSGVQDQFFDKSTNKLICLPARSAYPPAANAPSGSPSSSPVNSSNGAPWTDDEHARFLAGLELFPSGPWKSIASCVGTRTSRQTMSHAQKYRQKIARRQRGIRPGGESDSGRNSPQEVDMSGDDGSLMCSDLVDASTMTECLSEMQLNNELLDEILMSLFEDDGAPLLITQEDMDAIMATH